MHRKFLIPGGAAPEVELSLQLAKWAKTLQVRCSASMCQAHSGLGLSYCRSCDCPAAGITCLHNLSGAWSQQALCVPGHA